jgi:excisionase family DNA binding protein
MSICSTGLGHLGPLVVSTRQARVMLSCSHKKLYELLANGELQSFRMGSSRKVVVESIRQLVARRIAGGSNLKRPAGKTQAA